MLNIKHFSWQIIIKELLSKDGTFTIHEQNIQNLAIEMFKADFFTCLLDDSEASLFALYLLAH